MDPNNSDVLVAMGGRNSDITLGFRKIFRTMDGGANWTTYTLAIPADRNVDFIDININNSNRIYASTNGYKYIDPINSQNNVYIPCQLWTIDLAASTPTWTKINLTDEGYSKIQIDFSSQEPNSVFIMYRDISIDNKLLIKKSIDDGANWSTVFSVNGGISEWGSSKYAFEVSETDINVFYAGGDILYSLTGYSSITGFSDLGPGPRTHADIRAIQIKSVNNNDVILMGHDGGVSINTKGLAKTETDWVNLNGSSLCINEFFGFDFFKTNNDIIGGCQDNGTLLKHNNVWAHKVGGDGCAAIVNRENENIVYAAYNGGGSGIEKSFDGGLSFTSYLAEFPEQSKNGFDYFPMILDPTNNNYLWYGVHNLHKYNESSTSTNKWSKWTSTDSDPESIIKTIAISPSDNNYMYIGMRNSQYGNINAIKLYRTTDAGNTFTDITIHSANNNPFKWSAISEIVVDPYNPNHIFISFNGDDGTLTTPINKVYELIINGSTFTWNDLTNGLQKEERVYSLHYYEGSNGILFAGTNNGVYKLDFNQTVKQWIPYGAGVPNAIISQIKINECSNKIIVSTLGRGIWEANLDLYAKPDVIEITSNQTWETNSYRTFYRNVYVKYVPNQTTTLTIKGKVLFAKDVFLIIEPGAKVIIDGGKLLNSSSCSKWGGILVEGNPALDQNPTTNQGNLEMKNNAIIEGANNAVSTASYIFNNGVVVDYNWARTGGGIVTASNTTFRNNNRHIEFLEYHRKPNDGKNKSGFYNCIFEEEGSVDISLTLFNKKGRMVTAYKVNGVEFYACDFKNTNGSMNVGSVSTDRGTGIFTLDASITVAGKIDGNCNLIKAGTFTDLTTGIQNVWSPGATKMSLYNYLNFSLNDKGILLAQGNTTTIHNSTFDLSIPDTYYNKEHSNNTSSSFTGIAGISSYGASAFLIEQNKFVYNTGPNVVENNKIIIGTVLSYTDANKTGASIRKNTFEKTAFGTQTQLDNSGLKLTCNDYKTMQKSAEPPATNTYSAINLNPSTTANKTPDFGICDPTRPLFRTDYLNQFLLNTSNDGAFYKQDAANLPEIKTYVVAAAAINPNPPTTGIQMNFDNCQSGAPLLVIIKESCTNTASLSPCSIINKDPDPTQAKEKYFSNKTEVATLNDAINSGNLTTTGMQQALSDKAYYERGQEQARGEILWDYNMWEKIDTTINATDSIIAFLINESDLASKKLLVGTYYGTNKYSEALTVLNSIPNDGNEETNQFKSYYTLLINANNNNRNIFQLTEAEWTTITQIANSNTSSAESAKGLLILVKGNYFNNVIEKNTTANPLGKKSPTLSSIENSNELNNKNNLFVVYPNPADGKLFVNYNINNTVTKCTIAVTNVLGKTILTKTIDKAKGLLELDTKNWANGSYFIQLTNGNKVINTSTIIITH